MKINPLKFLGGFKGLLLVLAVGIGLSLHLYTQHIIHQLRNEARSLVEFYAQMYAKVAETPSDEDLSFPRTIPSGGRVSMWTPTIAPRKRCVESGEWSCAWIERSIPSLSSTAIRS